MLERMAVTAEWRLYGIGGHLRHHADHSGYDRLFRELEALPLPPSPLRPLAERLPDRVVRRLTRGSGSAWYGRRELLAEIDALWRVWVESGSVFHFFYGEAACRYLPLLPRPRRNRLVATFHQPEEGFREAVRRPAFLRRLDAIVVLSRSQAEFYERVSGLGERVVVVPHAVDTGYFTPAGRVAPRVRALCLFVGRWLRDFDVLRETILALAASAAPVDFVLVLDRERREAFVSLPNVTVCGDLSADELRDLYRGADLLLLPLRDSTANNTLLEAMACGLPAVATDVGGIGEYVDDGCARLVPRSDVRAAAAAVEALAGDEQLRRRLGNAARERAVERYALPRVARQMADVYRLVLGEKGRL